MHVQDALRGQRRRRLAISARAASPVAAQRSVKPVEVVGAKFGEGDVADMVCGDRSMPVIAGERGGGMITALAQMGEPALQVFTGVVPVRVADAAQLALLRHARGVRLGCLLGREVVLRRARLSAHARLPPAGLPAGRALAGDDARDRGHGERSFC
jgi:hypothetical protein